MKEKEVEVKILEIKPEQIIEKIKKIGGKFEGKWLIITQIYDFPNKLLISKGEYVRIRTKYTLDSKKYSKNFLTYKKKVSEKDVKIMEELELEINDSKIADEILKALGLKRILYFEKIRTRYIKDSIIFDIDELPQIPPFLEIESISFEKIKEGLKLLDIPMGKAVSSGPRELLAKYGLDIDKIDKLTFEKKL